VISDERARWLAAGSPPVPTLVVAGAAHVLQHPSQAGLLLGLETPPSLRDARAVAWDIDEVVEAWLALAGTAPWRVLLDPMPVLGRTALALTVDSMIGIAALPEAFSSGWFHWPGNPQTGETGDDAVVAYEGSVVGAVGGREDLLRFARPVAERWRRFLHDRDDELASEPDRRVETPRGELTWVELLEAQRLHAAQHLRQATTFVASRGCAVPELDLKSLHGLQLPEAIF
jgi:hypothetical protein